MEMEFGDHRQTVEIKKEPVAAIELSDGRIVTGKNKKLLGASAAAILNAIKTIAGIDDKIHLISPEVIEPIQKLKVQTLGNHNPRLHTDETLIALAIAASTNPIAKKAMDALEELQNCDIHSTVILSEIDVKTLKKLKMNITQNPVYQSKKLYHGSN